MRRALEVARCVVELGGVIESGERSEWRPIRMSAPVEQVRDVFAVEADGKVATVQLHRAEAGWSVHVMVSDQPDAGTVFLGHGFGPFANLEQAREAGLAKAKALLGGADRVGFQLRAAAYERARDPGNFDAVVETVDSDGNVRSRQFIKILNGGPQGRDSALETARHALQHVGGINEDGEIFV
ncbi:hypothetical protein [Stenotrophomonas maltophilia]|uniref:hypothetical protein n=1 Tax=Stenotrophomonas maltophilia TaxID=40324 RepID=UPI0011DDECCB|nr:hypothetical protein [Stenotrophomonas maltophilia]MCF3460792.1 hypothetical protein [Stenotrophomonas maltophilia]MCF3517747.1 hypothetical protein [Stenotrophomonas maltophilia]